MKTLQEANDFFKNDLFATEVTGVQLIDAAKGYAKCTLAVTPQHKNAAGSVMGGALFTLADFAFAVAANFDSPLTVTLSSEITYLSPAKGALLTAEAKCIRGGRKSLYVIDITDETGADVALITSHGYCSAA